MAGALYELQTGNLEDSSLLSTQTNAEEYGYSRKMQQWPRPLVIALCILGIWRPPGPERANSKQRARTHLDGRLDENEYSTVTSIDTPDTEIDKSADYGAIENDRPTSSARADKTSDNELLNSMQCDICNGEHTNEQSPFLPSTEAKRKSCLVRVLMILYLLGMCGLMTYDFAVYIKYGWGKRKSTLLLVSYFTYLFQVFAVPVFGLLTQLASFLYQGNTSRGVWSALQYEYIFRRFQYLKGSCVVSYVSYIMFLAWPTCNGVLRVIYDYVYRSNGDVHANISLWCAVVSYVMYGSFCYLIYIERVSFQKEFRVVAHFVASNAPKGVLAIDVCKDQLSAVFHQFRVMRDFVGIWMAFTMAVATWGITAHLTWNYVVYTHCDITKAEHVGLPLLNLLIWSQKIMFFILPSVAVGGLNVDYMWKEFRYIMVRHQRHCYAIFWSHIKAHMVDIKLFAKGLRATLVFSALGLYLGLELSSQSQNVDFWNGPGGYPWYNQTNFCEE